MIRKPERSPSLLPLPLVGLFVSILFIIIYTTIFAFAQPDGTKLRPAYNDEKPGGTETTADADTTIGVTESTSALSKSGTITFLALGRDEVSGLSDVVILAAFDTENMKLNVVQVPRDTYFRATEKTYRKINGASSALGGAGAFAEALENALCIEIDYTIQFTLEALGKVVDHIGGVPVSIPSDMDYDDPDQELSIHLEAGEYTLDGEGAKQFVRFRSGYIRGDIARIDAQKIFMAAFIRRLTEGVGIMKIPGLISLLMDDVSTDLSFSECLSYVQKALSLKTSDVTMVTLAGADVRTQIDSGAWYYIINREAALAAVNKYLNKSGTPVGELEFDLERRFTDKSYPHYTEIYAGSGYTTQEYRADDINKNGIGIGLAGR